MKAMPQIKVGCCGFSMAQQAYFQHYGLIENQQTFYQPPQIKTAEKWRASAPKNFEFTLKAWQLITHEPTSPTYRRLKKKIEPAHYERYGSFRTTEEVLEAWHFTALFACALEARLVVFQCPASFRATEKNVDSIRNFFRRIDRQGLQLAWEPRGDWPGAVIYELCKELNLIHCIDPFKNAARFGYIKYFRLHGINGYSYHYSDADLQTLKSRTAGKSTYVLFNNKWMREDSLRFMKLI